MNISKIKNLLTENTFINEVIYLDEVNSTNEYCRNEKNGDNLLVVAGYQTSGRGRFDRVWESEPGKNLLFSIKKKIPRKPGNYFSVNFYFTCFLLESIINHLQSNGFIFDKDLFEIKWPNDLLYDGKKLSGLLIESIVNKSEFIIGIGINVNQTKFPPSLDSNTTSLKKITRTDIELEQLLSNILHGFSDNFGLLGEEKSGFIYNNWKKYFKMGGRKVSFLDIEGREDFAQIIDINQDGSIKLLKNGKITNHFSGEIKLRTN